MWKSSHLDSSLLVSSSSLLPPSRHTTRFFLLKPFPRKIFYVRDGDVRRVLVADVVSHFFVAVRVVRVIFLCPFFCGVPASSQTGTASPSYTMLGVPVSGSR